MDIMHEPCSGAQSPNYIMFDVGSPAFCGADMDYIMIIQIISMSLKNVIIYIGKLHE